MCGFRGSNTQQNSQDLNIADSLSQRRVQAAAAFVDKGEMESCRVGNRLDVIRWGQVIIASGDGGELAFTQTLDCLGKLESRIQIRILIVDAVARVPTGVHSKLHQIRESPNLLSAGCLTTGQGTKLI